MVLGAIVDYKGNVRGVIHFVNKDDLGDKTISDEDLKNIEGILPTLGEVVRSADESSELSQICCCKSSLNLHNFFLALNQCLGKIVSSVPEDLKDMS